jgi:hypothetical protein
MACSPVWRLEVQVRRVWCIGGEAMSCAEVAFHVDHTAYSLARALHHIKPLTYASIRDAGLEVLLEVGSERGRDLGFLVDGSPFDLLELDAAASAGLDHVRRKLNTRYQDGLSSHAPRPDAMRSVLIASRPIQLIASRPLRLGSVLPNLKSREILPN